MTDNFTTGAELTQAQSHAEGDAQRAAVPASSVTGAESGVTSAVDNSVPVYRAYPAVPDDHEGREIAMSLARLINDKLTGAATQRDKDSELAESLLIDARRTISELWSTVGTRDEAAAGLLAAVEVAAREICVINSSDKMWKAVLQAAAELKRPFISGDQMSQQIDRLAEAGFDFTAPLRQSLDTPIVITIAPFRDSLAD